MDLVNACSIEMLVTILVDCMYMHVLSLDTFDKIVKAIGILGKEYGDKAIFQIWLRNSS